MSTIIYLYVLFLEMIERSISHHTFTQKNNILKFSELMNIEDTDIMTQTAIFCKKIVSHFDRVNK